MIKYFKLPWIQNTDSIPVTGGFHGVNQANTAMDFSPNPLIAPMDGCTITGSSSSGQNQYFNLNLPVNGRVYLQCVHGRPTRLGTFSKGEVYGVVNPFIHPKTKKRQDHWHISMNVNGVWFGVMTFIDRIIPIKLIGSPWTNPYDQWSFYNDRTLSEYIDVPANTEINLPIRSPDNDVPFVAPPEPTIIEVPSIISNPEDVIATPVVITDEPQPEAIITPAPITMPTITVPDITPPTNDMEVLDRELKVIEKLKRLEDDAAKVYEIVNTAKPETFSWLKQWRGAERVAAVTGTSIAILGGISASFVAITPALSEFISPNVIAIIGACIAISTIVSKTIYSIVNNK